MSTKDNAWHDRAVEVLAKDILEYFPPSLGELNVKLLRSIVDGAKAIGRCEAADKSIEICQKAFSQ